MPSIRYYNHSAPFWDFIANLESQGPNHPFFARGEGPSSDEEGAPAGPWGTGWGHRRWHRGPPPPHNRRPGPPGPPQPSDSDSATAAPPAYEGSPDTVRAEDEKAEDGAAAAAAPTDPPQEKGKAKECDEARGCEGRERAWRHGGCGGRGGHFAGRAWHGHRGRGPFPFVAAGPLGSVLAELFGQGDADSNERQQQDFRPDVDVFDTEQAFVIHVSLPGAKREDIGVNWDAEKSEVSIAGVTYRPADEEVVKTLALDERKVGPFERKVRLGSRANPAQVDADAITAKLEDGILVVEVPKLDKDYVEIKKVDIM